MMFLTSTDLSLMKLSVARGSRRLDVLLGTQCIDFLIISPSCFAGDFCISNTPRWTDKLFNSANGTTHYYLCFNAIFHNFCDFGAMTRVKIYLLTHTLLADWLLYAPVKTFYTVVHKNTPVYSRSVLPTYFKAFVETPQWQYLVR